MQRFAFVGLVLMLCGCTLSETEINADLVRYSKTNETDIFTEVGEKTRRQIQARRDVIEDCNINHHGAEFDIDRTASKVLTIYCERFEPLAIRLKKSSADEYAVLGYWTIKTQ